MILSNFWVFQRKDEYLLIKTAIFSLKLKMIINNSSSKVKNFLNKTIERWTNKLIMISISNNNNDNT